MELDARRAAVGTALEADVCIVGAGPVGLTLANALRTAGLHVVILDSGTFSPDAEASQLNDARSHGDPYDDLRGSRARQVGGTACIWNTEVRGERGAKFVPLDAVDFEAREGMPFSGWPFPRGALEPFIARARVACALPSLDGDRLAQAAVLPTTTALRDRGLVHDEFQFGSASHFCHTLPDALRGSPSVTLVHGATVTAFTREVGVKEIAAAAWTTSGGGTGIARARTFVLCAGAIENARLLLADQQATRPTSSPDSWLGCGFMEHPVDRSLILTAAGADVADALRPYQMHDLADGRTTMGRLALAPQLLRDQRLTNASVRLERLPAALWQRLKSRVRALGRPTARRAVQTWQLVLDLEQGPHRDNRILLSAQRDALGLPMVELHWRWHDEDERARRRIRAEVARAFSQAGLGTPLPQGSRRLNPNAHHHAGTTRMHRDPAAGVVDEQLLVHGERNLYVCGSSVFPTAGALNPTLSAVAMALRLGDHLSTP